MKFIFGSLLAFFGVFLLLATTSMNYLPKKWKNQNQNINDNILHNLIVNLGLLTCITYSLVRINIQPDTVFTVLLVTSLLILVINYKNTFKQIKLNFKDLIALTAIGTWGFLPGLLKSIREYSFLNMTSILNNDINAYSLISDLFLKTGSNDSGKIVGTNLNSVAIYMQHETPNILVAFVAKLFQLPTWRVMNLVIVFVIAFGVCATISVAKSLRPDLNKKVIYGISIVVALSPIQVYIFSNYFLGQATAFAIAMTMFARTIEIHSKNTLSKQNFIEIPFLISLAFYTYPIFLLPFAICCLIWYLLFNLSHLTKQKFKILMNITFAVLLGTLISMPYISTALKLFVLLNKIDSGWSIPPLTPLSLFINGDLLRDLYFPVAIVTSMWILSLVFLAICVIKIKSQSQLSNFEVFIILFTLVSGLFLLLSRRDFELGSYQNWKLISYFAPFIYILLLVHIYAYKRFRIIVYLLIFAACFAPVNAWRHIFEGTDLVVTRDMADLASNKRLSSLESINIDLNPFFESMAVAQIVEKPKIYFTSNQYWNRSKNDSACTLVKNENRIYLKTERLNSTYGLVSSMDKKCLISNPQSTYSTIDLREANSFSSKVVNRNFLLSGWGEIEDFGVWSIEENAELGFIIKGLQGEKYLISLEGRFYFPKSRDSSQIEVFVNEKFISREIFKTSRDVIEIPFQAPMDEYEMKIRIQVQDPISPAAEGLSNDTRRIGFGLESLSIKSSD
jgi:hypothetical protein